ncbi:MAG TPA: hypothetical protein VHN99_10010 [Deinococcales bacterium]|nr:hypothetical protein [Deinococcales bacterium]
MIALLAAYVSLTLAFGGGQPPAVSVAVDPWVLVTTSTPQALPWGRPGAAQSVTLPGLVWLDRNDAWPGRPDVTPLVRHELGHVAQYQALGAPAFLAAYALTGGQPFEDYAGGTWQPPPWDGRPRCPLLSWSPSGGLSLWACGPWRTP